MNCKTTTYNHLKLTAAELHNYHKDGFVVRTNVYSLIELNTLSQAIEAACVTATQSIHCGDTYYLGGNRFVDTQQCTVQFEHRAGTNTVRVIEPIHMLHSDIDALLDDPKITFPMRQLVNHDELALWTSKLNLKRANEGSAFGWHQDSPYWIHDCNHVDQLPNVMLTLDQQSTENGCFSVIRGSHAHGILASKNDGSEMAGFFTDPNAFDLTKKVDLVTSPGSLIFFNPHIVHGSNANLSEQPRRALILTYQPANHRLLKHDSIRNIKVQR